jgi:hypothetical protein
MADALTNKFAEFNRMAHSQAFDSSLESFHSLNKLFQKRNSKS